MEVIASNHSLLVYSGYDHFLFLKCVERIGSKQIIELFSCWFLYANDYSITSFVHYILFISYIKSYMFHICSIRLLLS